MCGWAAVSFKKDSAPWSEFKKIIWNTKTATGLFWASLNQSTFLEDQLWYYPSAYIYVLFLASMHPAQNNYN
jgi:hypothetical protein